MLNYRSTKKSKTHKCTQQYIREENLDKQLSKILRGFTLSKDWSDRMFGKLEQEEKEAIFSSSIIIEKKREETNNLNQKLARLVDAYLDQVIEREIYLEKQRELKSQKKTLEEQMFNLERNQLSWLEPMRGWIQTAVDTARIRKSNDLFAKKDHLFKINGSNLELRDQKANLRLAENGAWAALCAPNKKAKKEFLKNKIQSENQNFIPKNSVNFVACPELVPRTGLEPACP